MIPFGEVLIWLGWALLIVLMVAGALILATVLVVVTWGVLLGIWRGVKKWFEPKQ
jgi:hypothetical protein